MSIVNGFLWFLPDYLKLIVIGCHSPFRYSWLAVTESNWNIPRHIFSSNEEEAFWTGSCQTQTCMCNALGSRVDIHTVFICCYKLFINTCHLVMDSPLTSHRQLLVRSFLAGDSTLPSVFFIFTTREKKIWSRDWQQ